MADEKYTYSKQYNDEDLRAMAICIVNHLNSGDDIGGQFVMIMAQATGTHPQLVVDKIKNLANIQL